MLTELKAYSSWPQVPTLLLDDVGSEDTDLLQIRNITGLGPVKANINTEPFGSIDGESLTGTSVPARNIVITIGLNPDWNIWSVEALRRLVNLYFMPKKAVRLVFFSDDIAPVEITGWVESNEPNIFSKDNEIDVSIICPDPYFSALDPTIVTGITSDGSDPLEIDYQGSIETGINVKVTYVDGANPSNVKVQAGDPALTHFQVSVANIVTPSAYFEVNSVPGNKYIRNVTTPSGAITNLLNKLVSGSSWPVLQPGINPFYVSSSVIGHQDWQLTYYEKRGGL